MMSKNQLLVLKLKGWLQKERDHFRPLAEFAANRKGLHGCVEEKAGERRFLILPQFLEAQFPQARDRSTLIAALKERNALIHGDGRNTHEKRLPGTRKERVRFFGVRESMLC